MGREEGYYSGELTMYVEDKLDLLGSRFFYNYGVEFSRKDGDIYKVKQYQLEVRSFSEYTLKKMYKEMINTEGVTVYNLHMRVEDEDGKYLYTESRPKGEIEKAKTE